MLKKIIPIVGIILLNTYVCLAAQQQWSVVLIGLGFTDQICQKFLTLQKKQNFEAMRDYDLKLVVYNRVLAHQLFQNTKLFLEKKGGFKQFEKDIFPAGNLYQLAPIDINAVLFNFFCTNKKPESKEILETNLQRLIVTIKEKRKDLRAVEHDIKAEHSQASSPIKQPLAKTEPLWEGMIKPRTIHTKELFRSVSTEERLAAFANIIRYANAILLDLKNLSEKIKNNDIVLSLKTSESSDLTSSTIIHEDESQQGTDLTDTQPKEDLNSSTIIHEKDITQ